VVVAPGNAAIPQARPVPVSNLDGLVELARTERVDLTIVGPEAPLAAGLVDRLNAAGVAAFGPTRAAARLEWSKGWTKDFLNRHAIPTARAEIVSSEAALRHAVARRGLPAVLKADGLAAGKGVFVVTSPAEVDVACEQLFRRLGEAAEQVLVEECLTGPELSVLAFTDGERLAVMPPARDYKRLLPGDRGPNTGGMGGYTWPSDATPEVMREVEQRVLEPTLRGMQADGEPYRGVLYAGLMLTSDCPRVLEFNSRFGDPECQLILPLLDSGLAEICAGVANGRLAPDEVKWREGQTYGVVLAAHGYPETPRAGDAILGLDNLPAEVLAFHAGTRATDRGGVETAGGRVLTLVGFEREAVYRAADVVNFEGKQFRDDIGLEVPTMAGARR